MATPLTRRVDRGRGHSYFLDGEPVLGVTTILGDGIPKPALINWAARTTAGYAVDHWAELADVPPSERLRTLESARFESNRSASARGTQIHDLAARYVLGEEIEVADEVRGYVDSCVRFLEEWKPAELLVETVVLNRRWKYAGTLDLVATFEDRRWLLDWKTSASGVFPETALQLAAYANAETYLDGEGVEQPMPAIDAGAAVWLRTDGYDLVPLDIGDESFRTFLYAKQVAAFTRASRGDYVHDALAQRNGEASA